MTAPTLPAPMDERSGDGRPRRVDLALARAHLRLGSLALARAELETLAGMGALDAPGLVDLAEVRWRTGDLPGAGEAAAAALDSGAEDPVVLVIAAEAASADGRPSEARRLASLAMSRVDGRIDRIFAGMPRSAVWVPDAAEPPPTAATLFHREGDEDASLAAARGAAPDASAADAGMAPIPASDGTASEPDGMSAAAGPMTLGFWDAAAGDASAPELPDPEEAFHAGRAALVAGAFDDAAFRFGLAIRLAPALAPAVLEATEGARSVPLIVVRGDAYRLVGHEAEARQAYALAAFGGPPERRRRSREGQKPEGPPATGATGAVVLAEAPATGAAPESLPLVEAPATGATPEAVDMAEAPAIDETPEAVETAEGPAIDETPEAADTAVTTRVTGATSEAVSIDLVDAGADAEAPEPPEVDASDAPEIEVEVEDARDASDAPGVVGVAEDAGVPDALGQPGDGARG